MVGETDRQLKGNGRAAVSTAWSRAHAPGDREITRIAYAHRLGDLSNHMLLAASTNLARLRVR